LNLKVIFSGIAMSTIFGLSFLFTKNALDYVPVYTFLSYRFGMATLVMLLLAISGVIKLSKNRTGSCGKWYSLNRYCILYLKRMA